MNKHVAATTDATFRNDVLDSSLPVLVDFWAPWCGPCRIVGPVVEQLAEEFAGTIKVVKLNTDENPETSATYGIMSIPTLALFKNGQPVDGVLGAVPKTILKQLIEKHTQPVSVG
jgi:thioredoxin 1